LSFYKTGSTDIPVCVLTKPVAQPYLSFYKTGSTDIPVCVLTKPVAQPFLSVFLQNR